MSEGNLESLKQRILQLENENSNLYEQIDRLQEEERKVVSYRLFMEARDYLLKWLKTISLGLGGIGIITASSLTWSLYLTAKQAIEEQITRQSIVERIEKNITKQLLSDLREQINQKIDIELDKEIKEYFSQSALSNTVESQVQYQLARGREEPEPMFFVVAGYSNDASALKSDYQRAKRISGNDFGIAKHEVKICEPKESGNFSLVIGSKEKLPEAEQLVRQAIADNFRAANTFPISESEAPFDANKCKTIQEARSD